MEKALFDHGHPMKIYDDSETFSGPKEPLLTPFLSDDPSSHDSVIIFPGAVMTTYRLKKKEK